MGDPTTKKLENLKTLNSVLLKETKDRREQVESLTRSKGYLESALTRSESERNSMASELTQLLDRTDEMEVERDVVLAYVSVAVGERLEVVERERWCLEREMGQIEKVCGEVEFLKGELGARIEEANGLRLKLVEAEAREGAMRGEIEKLRLEFNGVVVERDERERQNMVVTGEKLLTEKRLEGANGVIDGLKGEIAVMGREMREIEEQRRVDMKEKTELGNKIAVMNELLLNWGKEEKLLRGSVADLERREMERAEEVERMTREIDGLVRENEERETRVEVLTEEKGKVDRNLDGALKDINLKNQKIDELIGERSMIEEAKMRIEGELGELKREIGELRVAFSSVEGENIEKTEEIRGLKSEVNRSRDEIARLINEGDDARKCFEEERDVCVSLREKVSEMEMKTEKTEEALTKVKSENRSVLGEKKELEEELDVLKSKVASLEGSLSKGSKEIDNLRARLLKSDANLGFILKIMKGVRDGDMGTDEGEYVSEEIKPCLDELVTIKREMRKGEAMVEEMKKQVGLLNNSIEEAHKKKSFWAVVSSATTIFAAASMASAAFIARAH